MKIKSLLIAAMLLLSVAVTSYGIDKPVISGLVVIPVQGKQVFKIIYKGETAGTVKISVVNSSRVTVYTEVLSNVDGFILPLNFSDLEYGDYAINVTDAAGKRTERITYVPQITSLGAIHIAKIGGQNRYLVAIPAQGEQVVNIKIYDHSNNLLHEETKEVNGNFGQVYNTKNIQNTSGLTFQVTDSTGNTKTVKY